MKRAICLMCIALLGILRSFPAVAAEGDEFDYDGITYKITSEEEKTVKTFNGNRVQGKLVLPSTISHAGSQYTLTEIGDQTFIYHNGLNDVTIPNTVTRIGELAFSGCLALKTINILPSSIKFIGGGAFNRCEYLTRVDITDLKAWCEIQFEKGYIHESNPLCYAKHLFLNGNEITDLVIPDNIKKIGDIAFAGGKYITSVTIPTSVIAIGEAAFYGAGLKNVTIPTTVSTVEKNAFFCWENLEKIQLEAETPPDYYMSFKEIARDGLTLIVPDGSYCAYQASEWSGFSKIREACGLAPTTISDGEYEYKFVPGTGNAILTRNLSNQNSDIVPSQISVEIGDEIENYDVVAIGEWAFQDTQIEKITFPACCKYIGAYAFASAKIKEITLNGSDMVIGRGVFYDCRQLTTIKIPGTIASLGINAFATGSEKKVYINNFPAWCRIKFKGEGANPISSGELYVDNKLVEEVVISDEITEIGDYAFYDYLPLKRITLHGSITSIGSNSFNGCQRLSEITLPASVSRIGERAFQSCSSLTSVTIPEGISVIETGTFSWCTALSHVALPLTITKIGSRAFAECSNLTHFEIPSQVRKIEDSCFSSCTSLVDIALNHGIDEIESWSFYGCSSLAEIIIPSSITKIGERAFGECSSLKNIAIGCGIKLIEFRAFEACTQLSKVYVTAIEPAQAYDETFSYYNPTLWLTPGASANYQSAERCWQQFYSRKDLIVPTSFNISENEIKGRTGEQFQLNAVFTPADVTLPFTFWQSSDISVATVDRNGLVTIIDGTRNCEITAFNLYVENSTAKVKVTGLDAGIYEIETDQPELERPSHVYNLQGVRLKRDATQSDIDALPAGIYIIGGKKVYVK
ncbi:MAG: leucine-rich repeat protein [Muribaculaceae bacterium]|nr:leucine-rich repeat protein [Muribaculaceae bacterium]